MFNWRRFLEGIYQAFNFIGHLTFKRWLWLTPALRLTARAMIINAAGVYLTS